jgi:PTS system nitrogen regulatory IIA component
MQLTVRDVARALGTEEKTVYRWVSHDGLPAELINGQYRFNRTELLEWAALRKKEVSPDLFSNGDDASSMRLDDALRAGGILEGIQGADKDAVLRAVVEAMPLPAEFDRAFLLEVLLSRESLGSTDIGDGLAIPHPRYPVVLPIERPSITLCFLAQPIAFSTSASQPVHTLFTLVSPTARTHLQLLARLAHALRDASFRAVVRRKARADEILREAGGLENALRPPLVREGT